MGPTVLLDKSTLQSIARRGTHELARYFLINLPPVLLLEILSGLAK
jgi:hypothetical protein